MTGGTVIMVFPFCLSLHKTPIAAGGGKFRESGTLKGAESTRAYRGFPLQTQKVID
jgi:hypothetical protein